jgi:hypothetical protein
MDFKRYVNLSYALMNRKAHRCFHTSFVVRKGKVLAIGINQIKTHPKIKQYGYHALCGLHSELDAALKLGFTDCSDLILINIRIDGKGQLNMSKPCQFCQKLIKQLNFKSVFYSGPDGKFHPYYQSI